MTELFILRNQHGYFLGKQKDWLDGRDRNALYKTLHKDEAVNQMVELSAKDFEQRIRVVPCEADERGLPVVSEDDMPPRAPKARPSPKHEGREESPEGLDEAAAQAESAPSSETDPAPEENPAPENSLQGAAVSAYPSQ
ncbi:hypothetical protein [Marinimicrobium sp. ARAG 43.8]|uniref:hypothetical protein n=1 Tax=Marinimicrobium sp. ARAG 43.8 TaxID=3418719 RepID=UPI003CEB0155